MPTDSLTSAVFGSFSIARCMVEAASAAASGFAASTITLSAVPFIRRAPHEAAACPRRNWQRSSASCAGLVARLLAHVAGADDGGEQHRGFAAGFHLRVETLSEPAALGNRSFQ
jgi:hypothetical protein